MSRELICVTCPLGCALLVEEEGSELRISGNRCPRGAVYAREELLAPKRVVTATCRLSLPSDSNQPAPLTRRLSLKSSAPFPRERIPELLGLIGNLEATPPIRIGDLLARNLFDTGIDLVATRDIPP